MTPDQEKPEHDPRFVSRRKFLTAAATAVGGLTLAACGAGGGGSTGASATTGAAAAAPTTAAQPTIGVAAAPPAPGSTQISVWFWDDAIQYAVDIFNKKQTKVGVKFEKKDYDSTHKSLLTSMAAGSGAPDVCAIEIGYVGAFSKKGGLADMLQAPFDAGQFKNDVVEYKWKQGTSPDGRLVCMPWDIGPGACWIRTDLFEKAGLETDPDKLHARIKTWDDWFQLGEDLRKKLPNTALVADAFQDVYNPLLEQQGHGWFDGNKLLFEEKATKPLQRAVEARKRKIDANIVWWGAEWETGLKKDAFAGMNIPCWEQTFLTRELSTYNGKWRIFKSPEGDWNSGGSFLSIPEQGKHKDAAWEFVKFSMCTAEGQNAIFKPSGIFPAFKPAWKDPIYDQPVEFFGGQKAFRLWTDIASDVPGNVVSPNDQQAGSILGDEITKVNKQGKDPAQATKDAENEAVKRIRGITK